MASRHHFDVVIAGDGDVALVTALSMHESGARVAILKPDPWTTQEDSNYRIDGRRNTITPLLPRTKEWVKRGRFKLYAQKTHDQDIFHPLLETVKEMNVGCLTGRFVKPGQTIEEKHIDAVKKMQISIFKNTLADNLLWNGNTVLGAKTIQCDKSIELIGQVILAYGGLDKLQGKNSLDDKTIFSIASEKKSSMASSAALNESESIPMSGQIGQPRLGRRSIGDQPNSKTPSMPHIVREGNAFAYGGLKTATVVRALDSTGLHIRGLWIVGGLSGNFGCSEAISGIVDVNVASKDCIRPRRIASHLEWDHIFDKEIPAREVVIDSEAGEFAKRQELFIAEWGIILSAIQL